MTKTKRHSEWIRTAVDRHEGPLLRYAARIVGDLEEARDVVQETFLRLCKQDRAQIDGHLTEWLFTVCRNRALDVCRKERRMKTMSTEQAAVQQTREREQSSAVEDRDSAEQIERVLAGLSDNQQEVVRLKFQSGLSYREISNVTQLSITNVGYLIHTALAKIRKEVGVDCS